MGGAGARSSASTRPSRPQSSLRATFCAHGASTLARCGATRSPRAAARGSHSTPPRARSGTGTAPSTAPTPSAHRAEEAARETGRSGSRASQDSTAWSWRGVASRSDGHSSPGGGTVGSFTESSFHGTLSLALREPRQDPRTRNCGRRRPTRWGSGSCPDRAQYARVGTAPLPAPRKVLPDGARRPICRRPCAPRSRSFNGPYEPGTALALPCPRCRRDLSLADLSPLAARHNDDDKRVVRSAPRTTAWTGARRVAGEQANCDTPVR